MVICLERSADLHMVQLMPLPLTVSCFSKIQIGFIFLVPAHPGSPRQRAVNDWICVCAYNKTEAPRYHTVGRRQEGHVYDNFTKTYDAFQQVHQTTATCVSRTSS